MTEKLRIIAGHGICVGSGGGMKRARWLAPWKDSVTKPAMYHCVSRVVDRQFVFGEDERENYLKSGLKGHS